MKHPARAREMIRDGRMRHDNRMASFEHEIERSTRYRSFDRGAHIRGRGLKQPTTSGEPNGR